MKAIFVPSLAEAKKIFPSAVFRTYKYNILQGEYRGIQVFVTGVSKIPSVFSLTTILNEFPVSEAVLTGVCGAYRDKGLRVGDIVAVKNDYFADEGLYADGGFKTLSEMGFGFLESGYAKFHTHQNLTTADSNTVSFLDGEGEISEILSEKTGASVENMEGAAFGYVCNMLKIKAYQIRAVSNYCGRRDSQEWDFKQAVSNLKKLYVNFEI